MKKALPILVLVLASFTVSAQEFIFNLMERTDLRLQEVEVLANRYFDSVGTGRGTGYKQFQRWLYERKFHTDENGNYIPRETDWNNYVAARGNMPNYTTNAANWTPLGPSGWTYTSGWNPGTGRLTSMAIHPANESVIYVGSPGGGLWKTTNAGTSWTALTDNNNLWMNVFSVTIDPNNQNIVYAGMSGVNLVLKSTDGGATWNPTGSGPGTTVRKILIHPSNSNIVFAAGTNGIWRSVNAGASWTNVHSGSKEDIEFKPDDLNIMYATGNDVYRSTDNGQTWTPVGSAQGITNTGRTLVSVTPANPDVVYIVQASGSLFGRMYKSTNAGLSFITTIVGSSASGTQFFGYEASGTGTSGQATYDMAMTVSPTNAEEVYIAGIIVWKTINGGTSFVPLTEWFYPNSTGYNHADVHGLDWVNSSLYSLSDGGIYKSTDAGNNWTDLSPGLNIRQFYRIAVSQTNASVITGGAQDNGSVARQTSNNWVDWLGADGMEGLVSPTDHLRIWGTSQNGSIYRSINGGNTYSNLPRPSPGQWVTPLWIHPTDQNILYGGWTGVYKSTNAGSSWTNISAGTIGVTLADIAVSRSDPNYIYASTGSTLWMTSNDGASWNTYSAPATINDIAISPTDPLKIWIACNSTTNRVLVSTNGGQSFTNISDNLPNIVARAIALDNFTPQGIYVGMNIGVFFKEETASAWTNYSDNLPMVAVNELEIQHLAGKIRVATYGRGVWESNLATNCALSAPTADFTANQVTVCETQSITFNNTSTDCQSTWAWTFPGGTPSASTDKNPTVFYNTPGVYDVTLVVTNPGGTATRTRNAYITVSSSLTHSISISASATDICANESVNFNMTATNPGTSPTITWTKNGVLIPGTAGQTSISLSNLANNDVIRATETTSAGCASPATVNSNAITILVSPNLIHSASISSPKTQLCSGESATFTLNSANPGSSPTITWFRNGNVIPGTSGQTSITLTSPADGDVISASESSNARCVSPVSIITNQISLVVTPTPAKPTITQVIGDLMSSAISGNQWYLNGNLITGATGAAFHPLLNGTYQVRSTVNSCSGQLSDPYELKIEGINLLYPVPSTTGVLTFDYYTPAGANKYNLSLYNNLGQLVKQQTGGTAQGLNRLNLNWETLAAGIYRLQVQVGNVVYKKDLLIQ